MTVIRRSRARATARVLLAAVGVAAAASCDSDPNGPNEPGGEELVVVLNSVERSLTVFPADSPGAAFTIGLAPDGSPVSLATRGATAVVPLGTVPAAAVVDLRARLVRHTVALPAGSGATGVAFLDDSLVVVGNPGLNTVSVVNVRSGTRGQDVPVGVFPQAMFAVPDTVFVLNAQLGPDFSPAGPGTISVLTGSPPVVIRTIQLAGLNPGAGAVAGNALFVLHAGRFGQADGSLSIVDRATLAEASHVPGFGEFPGSIAVGPDGRVYAGSFSYGIAVWSPSGGFVRAPGAAVEPGGVPATSGIGFDAEGRLYALRAECVMPGAVLRLDETFAVEREIPAGICPIAIGFTLPAEGD